MGKYESRAPLQDNPWPHLLWVGGDGSKHHGILVESTGDRKAVERAGKLFQWELTRHHMQGESFPEYAGITEEERTRLVAELEQLDQQT